MTDYTNPVPENRTIVPGAWSDLLDYQLSTIKTTNRGDIGVGVLISDQTSDPLDVPFLNERATGTLAADTVIDARTFTLNAGHGTVAGDVVELSNGVDTFMQTIVLTVNVNTITVDQPINAIYAAGSDVIIASDNMLVDGSVTPVIFSVKPEPHQAGDFTRISIEIRSSLDMDFTTLGGKATVTNGCVLRVKRADGTYKNILNFKSNGDYTRNSTETIYLLPKQGNSTNGFFSSTAFGGQDKRGVVIRLDGSLGEELQLVVQDDLTADNIFFKMDAQGHEVAIE